MRRGLCIACAAFVLIVIGFESPILNAGSGPQSLCNLPQLGPGTSQSVRLAAVAEFGTDMGVLTDASCPSIQPTWFELSLKSGRNRTKLHNQLEKTGSAAVVFTGQLYGPPLPDRKLPESIRRNYHAGWGHLGAFPLKLVVFRIDSVAPIGRPAKGREVSKTPH